MTPAQFTAHLAARVKAAGGMRALGRRIGFSAAYISLMLKGERQPGAGFLKALGLEQVERSYVAKRKR